MKKQKREISESLVCRELVLVDSKGAMVAMFTTLFEGISASLRMYDKDGVERWIMEVADDDILRMCFISKDTKLSLGIAVSDDKPGIGFYDKNLRRVGEIYLDDEFKLQIRGENSVGRGEKGDKVVQLKPEKGSE